MVAKKKRVLPVRRKVKHLDWLMMFITRTTPCAICGETLSSGYDKRNPGKSITLHHTEGGRETDMWDNPTYVAKMVLAHVSCHRSYHFIKRHQEAGFDCDVGKLRKMERNIAKTLRKQKA